MTLRILAADADGLVRGADAGAADDFLSRLVKLIPAEAIALYTLGAGMVPDNHVAGRFAIMGICLVVSGVIRFSATRSAAGVAQWRAIWIALVSFVLWTLTLTWPMGPLDLGEWSYLAIIVAMAWGILVPIVYKGS